MTKIFPCYKNFCTLWDRLISLHEELLQIALNEYRALLASDFEELEKVLNLKQKLIEKITIAEKDRSLLVLEFIAIADSSMNKKLKLSEILFYFSLHSETSSDQTLKIKNEQLINLISNIQMQNKKNRVFLNRAMISLQDLQKNFSGKKNFTTYNQQGEKLLVTR